MPVAPWGPRNQSAENRAADVAWLLVCVVVSSLAIIAAGRQLGVTFDEPFYIAQGLEFWRTGSHARLMSKGTMPLAVDLATLPLRVWELWSGIRFDPVADLARVLPVARTVTLVFWWLLLTYGWLAGRSLGGPWGGRLAVALLATEPNILGHAGLATTDIAVTACLVALVYHFRTGREAGWVRRLALPTFWYGAAVLAKASGLVYGPLCLVAVEVERLGIREVFSTRLGWSDRRAWWQECVGRFRPLVHDLSRIVLWGLVLVFVYCGSDWRAEPSFVAWARSLPDGVPAQAMTWLAENLRIFTNAGQGLVKQIQHNIRGHGVFLLGEVWPRAVWYYFPVALSIKTTLGVFLALAAVAMLRPSALRNWAVMAATVLLVFSLNARVQIGIRFLFPMVALGLVGLAAATAGACREQGPGWRKRLLLSGVVAGVIWAASACVTVWPHGLTYANELWGGPEKGYLHLSDSNYDWGQGLPELARWHREHGSVPLAVWYFGTDPVLRDLPIRDIRLHDPPVQSTDEVLGRVRGHYLAISTTLLHGAYLPKVRQIVLDTLRTRQPVARTMTFLIYDFTREAGT